MNADRNVGAEPVIQHGQLAEVTLYALGALAGADRERVREHIAGCGVCRDELVRITGVRTLLGRLTTPGAPGPVAVVPPPSQAPPAVLRERVINQVLVNRRAQAHRRRRLVSIAAAAALVAVPTTVAVTSALNPDHTLTGIATPAGTVVAEFRPMQLAPTAGHSAAASAAITAQPWGTAISVQATDFAAGAVIDLYVVPHEGQPEQVGSWQAGTGTITCAATTWYPRSQLQRIEARQEGGAVVASQNVTA